MKSPGGYAVLSGPNGVAEADTFTCFHCQRIVHVRPLADAAECGGLCKICMRLICSPCVSRGTCTPWEKEFERMEARQRFLRSAGL